MIKITQNCPFCKATPEDHDDGDHILSVGVDQNTGKEFVGCDLCGARGPQAESYEQAIERWEWISSNKQVEPEGASK